MNNKHLRRIVDEYLSTNLAFEDELLDITRSIRRDTNNYIFYLDHYYALYKHQLFEYKMEIKFCNDIDSWFYKQWVIEDNIN